MKKIFAMAAAAVLACGASAFAANPFSDVTPDDWAYQAVSDLSDQGIVEGYPDGTFKGQRNMTRYELAQIIARLMAREDQMNAEQRAIVDKLASEYADELANLGVRVGSLEKKVGNIYWTGDARMRYQTNDNTWRDGRKRGDGWNGRMRLIARGQVNDSTYVQGRLAANMNFKDSSSSDGNVSMEQLFVHHQFGDFNVRLGKQPVVFGNQQGWLYGDIHGMDGAQLGFATADNRWNAAVGYGRFNTSASDNGYKNVRLNDAGVEKDVTDMDAFYAKAAYNWNPYSNFNANYVHFTGNSHFGRYGDQDNGDIWGLGTTVSFGSNYNWRVFGEYWNNSTASRYDNAWNAGLGYGHLDLNRPGSFDVDVVYNKVGRNVYFGGTGYEVDVLNTLNSYNNATSVKFWNIMADVTLMKNVFLHGQYAFDVNADHSAHGDHDAWTVSLYYMF